MKLAILSAAAAIVLSGHTLANDAPDGAALIAKNCTRCHDDSVYTRPNRRVKSLAQLGNQVRNCDRMVGSKLFDDEISSVINHLNTTYYKF